MHTGQMVGGAGGEGEGEGEGGDIGPPAMAGLAGLVGEGDVSFSKPRERRRCAADVPQMSSL